MKSRIPGVTGIFDLGVHNEAGQRLTEFYQENALVIANTLFQQHKRRLYTYSEQKQEQELTVAQIMNSLLQNSDLN